MSRQLKTLVSDHIGYGPSKRNSALITLRLFRRKDSALWQCSIRHKGRVLRMSTGAHMRSSAEAFAMLAESHFTKHIRKTGQLPKSVLISNHK